MIIPSLQGTCTQHQFFIYAACDQKYFDEFGKEFIHSIQQNTNLGIHMHVFNPTEQQIAFCNTGANVSMTYEHVPIDLFQPAADKWNRVPTAEPLKSQYDRTLNAMGKGRDTDIQERMQKTYYACARFVRLAQLFQSTQVLCVDVDAVVRKSIPDLGTAHDFFIHRITGKKARFLAGGLYLNPTDATRKFLQEYADQLTQYISQDYIYWGLDQDLLDPIVPQYNFGQLPISCIDWDMRDSSCIWTAKGTRKELAAFVSEKQKYSS
jgi:hypothetical protein